MTILAQLLTLPVIMNFIHYIGQAFWSAYHSCLSDQNAFFYQSILSMLPSHQISLVLISLFVVACQQDRADSMFTEMSRQKTGVDFRNLLKEDENFNIFKYQYFNNGGGLAVGDFNNDGLQDLVFTGNMVKNRLFVNEGDFHFEDHTTSSGIAEKEGWCTGATTVDINEDGWLDLYICRAGYPFDDLRTNLLFINNGDLTFSEKAAEYGIADEAFSTHSAFFDYDLDGDLDLFVLNHSTVEYSRGSLEVLDIRNKKNPDFTNKLFRNDNGHFTNVTEEAGIFGNVLTFSLGLSIADINQDGWPDIYVGNDFNEPDYLFINQKDGRFEDQASAWFDHMAMFSMGSDIADINNDGLPDLVSLDMLPESNYQQKMHSGADNFDKVDLLAKGGFLHQSSRNMLQLNSGDSRFTEIGQFAGVSNTNWSWAPLFFDFDNDGHKDLFIANGYPKDHTDMDFLNFTANEVVKINQGKKSVDFAGYMEQMPPILLPNYFYQNNGDLQFDNKTTEWGLNQAKISQSAAYADLDNDGDLDLILNNTAEYANIYRNNARALTNHHYLKVRLQGTAKNPQAIGAKVYLYAADQLFYQEQQIVRGFQSTVDANLIFGLGTIEKLDSLKVISPLGKTFVVRDVAVDRELLIDLDKEGSIYKTPDHRQQLLLEADQMAFIHQENPFNDFKVQSLMPWYYSCEGPALALGDVNGDGRSDFYIGNASGAEGMLWLQPTSEHWSTVTPNRVPHPVECEETAAVFFDAEGDGDLDLYVASGSYEFSQGDPRLKDYLYLNDGAGNMMQTDALPDLRINTTCVAAADADNDGDTDLFIGGGYQFGAYPKADLSYVLINDGHGQFKATPIAAGQVNAASWADLNADGQLELIMAGEWTSLQIFQFRAGQWERTTREFVESPLTGLWASLLVEDMDADGDLDIIAGNLGLNSQLTASETEPLQLYAADVDQNGSIDPLLFYYVQGTSWPFASRDDLIGQLPHLKKKFLFFKDYANAQLPDILPQKIIDTALVCSAQTLASVYYENDNGQLRAHLLPYRAQLAPVRSIAAKDLNGDGYTDLILGGNLLQAKVKLGRLDGNHGVVLLGNGDEGFLALSNGLSGLDFRGSINELQWIETNNGDYLLAATNNGALQTYRLNEEYR